MTQEQKSWNGSMRIEARHQTCEIIALGSLYANRGYQWIPRNIYNSVLFRIVVMGSNEWHWTVAVNVTQVEQLESEGNGTCARKDSGWLCSQNQTQHRAQVGKPPRVRRPLPYPPLVHGFRESRITKHTHDFWSNYYVVPDQEVMRRVSRIRGGLARACRIPLGNAPPVLPFGFRIRSAFRFGQYCILGVALGFPGNQLVCGTLG